MRNASTSLRVPGSLKQVSAWRAAARRRKTAAAKALASALGVMIVLPGFAVGQIGGRGATTTVEAPPPQTTNAAPQRGTVFPKHEPVRVFAPLNVRQAARQEALAPQQAVPNEIRAIHAPKGEPPPHGGVPIATAQEESGPSTVGAEAAPTPSSTGPSPGPSKTFKSEFLSSTSIPPDTMGAVGTTHIVNTTNDRMSIMTRDGVLVSRMTLSSFWAGVALEGGAAVSAFDPKVLYDRFNSRWILISSANAQAPSSAALFAVSQTNDPTGTWNRYAVDADPTATAAGGRWIDYPTIGFNKNWIVVMENVFNYGTAGGGYYGPAIYVLDKQAAYSNTLSTISVFADTAANCVAPFETALGCGFTMAPSITEDNTTETNYLVEDWDSQAGQLRLSRLTGTASAPVLTLGTQFPQSPQSWRFNAARISGTSGGYAPQRQQALYLPSGTRIMTNDSRIQNAVLRNGSLWTTHTVMLSSVPTPAGVAVGGAANPDNHSGVQWWEIDPTVEGGAAQPPIQRGRIEDPTANNCHNGSGGLSVVPTCDSTAEQVGQFYAFPNISVNQNEDVLIGFSQFSPLTYPSAGYAIRLAADAPNTMRDPVVYRPGQANYNIGSGSGTARQNRWGDYSASQTDPLNDTDFWTVQEYAGTVRDFGIGLAGNWETWWANVKPSAVAPSPAGTLVINEFRLRGPQGARDEFVELYNPGAAPVIVNTTDNSDGWALAYSANGTTVTGVTVIPNGTVIKPRGSFLIANNPDGATAPTLVYSLNAHPNTQVRASDSDAGYSIDLADNGGVALFRTSTVANFTAATRVDAVGFSTIAAGLFKEGNGIPAMTTQPTSNFSYYRTLCPSNAPTFGTALGCTPGSGSQPKDTNANETDFVFVDTSGTSPTAGVQRLGAPGPTNLDSPLVRNDAVQVSYLDPSTGLGDAPPNRVRDTTPDPTNNSNFGTISIRRKVTNNTGANVTRLRFRIIDITTYPAPAGFADLRARTSGPTTATVTGVGVVSVLGTTLEEPPAQPNGGAFNSTLSAGTITLAAPIAPGASVNVQFLLGVQQTGSFRFFVSVEAQ